MAFVDVHQQVRRDSAKRRATSNAVTGPQRAFARRRPASRRSLSSSRCRCLEKAISFVNKECHDVSLVAITRPIIGLASDPSRPVAPLRPQAAIGLDGCLDPAQAGSCVMATVIRWQRSRRTM